MEDSEKTLSWSDNFNAYLRRRHGGENEGCTFVSTKVTHEEFVKASHVLLDDATVLPDFDDDEPPSERELVEWYEGVKEARRLFLAGFTTYGTTRNVSVGGIKAGKSLMDLWRSPFSRYMVEQLL